MPFLRYPGGKSKQLKFICDFLPKNNEIKGNFIEPFVGGGSIFLSIKPQNAILSDLNNELIELYQGIKDCPREVWDFFYKFPEGKNAYYQIRDSNYNKKLLPYRAARILYLNRTCFKGMWRNDPNGNFNVGYGGDERRWAITYKNLMEISSLLKKVKLEVSDFENTLKNVKNDDFIFLDPPYKPGCKELKESHYTYSKFIFDDQIRLANILTEISKKKKKLRWVMTNSSHADIKKLYKEFNIIKIPKGTSDRIGIQTEDSKEILIRNF